MRSPICPVCYESNFLIWLECLHPLCGGCIKKLQRKECPLCRETISPIVYMDPRLHRKKKKNPVIYTPPQRRHQQIRVKTRRRRRRRAISEREDSDGLDIIIESLDKPRKYGKKKKKNKNKNKTKGNKAKKYNKGKYMRCPSKMKFRK